MNEPNHAPPKAVALRYDQTRETAPRVVATGKGLIAEQIMKVAREHNIPVRYDPDLLELLSTVDIDRLIPVEAYRVIAELFAFLYRLNQEEKR